MQGADAADRPIQTFFIIHFRIYTYITVLYNFMVFYSGCIMPSLPSKRISFQTPSAKGATLLFRLFDNALPIGYGRLGILPVKPRVSLPVTVAAKAT